MPADRSQVVEQLPAHLRELEIPLAWWEYVESLARQLEQVEAERDEIQRQFDSINWSSCNWTNALKAVEAERDRYREALERAASLVPNFVPVQRILKAALHPQEGDGRG